MKTGSIFIKLKFPYPWPIAKDQILFESNDQGALVSIKGLSSGKILFSASDKSRQLVEYTSPQIKIPDANRTFAVISFVWEEKQPTKMYINGAQVGQEPVNLESLGRDVEADPVSIYHPEKLKICAEYIEKRRKGFILNGNQTTADRIPVPIEQQLCQLQAALQALSGLIVEVLNGRDHFLGHIATDIRALLYYPKGGPFVRWPYNPLLLRLASFKNIELPVYFVRSIPDNGLGLLEESTHFVEDPLISIFRYTEKQKIGDLCECLEQRVLRIKPPDSKNPKWEKGVSLNELMRTASTTIGTAHYDVAVPWDVDFIRKLIIGEQGTLLKKIILDVGKITLELGKYVVAKFQLPRVDD